MLFFLNNMNFDSIIAFCWEKKGTCFNMCVFVCLYVGVYVHLHTPGYVYEILGMLRKFTTFFFKPQKL